MYKVLSVFAVMTASMALFGCKSQEVAVVTPAPTVELMEIVNADVPLEFKYIGQSVGSMAVEVRAQVTGILTSRNYNEGDYVQEGQVLFNIEPTTYRAVVNQAKAKLNQSEAQYTQNKQNFDRVKDLYEINAVSQLEFDTAKANLDVASAEVNSSKASLQDAEVKLKYTYVVAPVSGYASKENFTIGNLISANSMDSNLLTVINKIDPIYINIAVPESEYKMLRAWKDAGRLNDTDIYAEATLNSGVKYPIKGKIIFTDKRVDQTTGSVAMKIEFQNESAAIFPGEYIQISLVGYKLVNTLTIPQRAILQSKDDKVVVIVDENSIAHFRKVFLGNTIDDLFIVEDGLNVGEKMVIEGANKVKDGENVNVNAIQKSGESTTQIKG